MERNFLTPKNQTLKQLKRIKAALIRIHRMESRMRTLERKQDTRRKIQLGGLVKKAGLDKMPTAELLGLLIEASEFLQDENSESIKSRWRLKGDIALTMEQEKGLMLEL